MNILTGTFTLQRYQLIQDMCKIVVLVIFTVCYKYNYNFIWFSTLPCTKALQVTFLPPCQTESLLANRTCRLQYQLYTKTHHLWFFYQTLHKSQQQDAICQFRDSHLLYHSSSIIPAPDLLLQAMLILQPTSSLTVAWIYGQTEWFVVRQF